MKCKQARKVLSRYLDHELPSTQMASVERHLACCPECQAEQVAQERLWTLLGRAEPIRSPDLVAAVEARLWEPRGWASYLGRLRLRSIGSAAAIAVLVGLFVWTGLWAGTARQRFATREHDRAFAELLTDVPPGMEVVAVLDEIGQRP